MSDITVLIVEPRQLYRELLGTLLSNHGFNTLLAASGAEGLQHLGKSQVRLILVDVDLPAMSGFDFLQHVRQTSNGTPAIVLTDRQDRDSVIRAAKLHVRNLLLKGSLSSQGLIERIGRLTADPPIAVQPAELPVPETSANDGGISSGVAESAIRTVKARSFPAGASPAKTGDLAGIPQLLTRAQTLQRLDTVASGKTIAGVVAQVIALASSPDADLSEIVRVIQGDPILAARILQLANSAATGGRHRVNTIEDGARPVGLRGIQNMAISIGIFGAFPSDESDGFNSMRCWQHSFAVADLMGTIVRERNSNQEGLNHLVGLCHDLGEILLRQHFSAEYATLSEIAQARDFPIHQVVPAALGIRHPELISRLLIRMGLPPNVTDAIREFHERQIREQANGLSAPAQLLQIANLVAHGMLLAPSTHERVRPITRTEWRCLNPDRDPPAIDVLCKHNEIVLATNTLARLPAREQEHFLRPIIPNSGLRLGYIRPPTFTTLDPLAFALQMLGSTEILSDPPRVDQLQQLDALIVTAIRPGLAPVIPGELMRMTAAAGRPELPILALTGQLTATESHDSLTIQPYPVRLADLHRWLLTVKSQKHQSQSSSARLTDIGII